jgi:Protein of unknown function (DUF2845)
VVRAVCRDDYTRSGELRQSRRAPVLASWEVKERCGESSAIDDVTKHLPQRAYNPISQTSVYILVPVQQSIWTYNFGSTRFLYYLTFQEGKLIDITTGDDGY